MLKCNLFLNYKYRLYPTEKQVVFLNEQLRDACELYNAALEERIGAWKVCHKSISVYDQTNQLPAMRADGCLKLVNAKTAEDVLRRLDKTFRAFFARCRRGDKPGFPRFKPYRRYDSFTYPQFGNGCKLLDNGKLKLQGAGHVKIKLHRPIEGKIKTLTIKREAGKWYAYFCAEGKPILLPASNDEAGIDVGLTTFAVLSNGEEIENPRFYRKAQAKLRTAQRKVAQCKKGSNRRRKAAQELQRVHAHVTNQRSDFHHKESRKLVNKYGLIAAENLNVKGLAAGMLAKSVNDAGWGYFLSKIAYKAENAGRQFVKVDARGTSQICLCGQRVPKTLKERWHECPECGLSMSRDLMSARVILQRARNLPSGANVEAVSSCVA